MPTPNTTDRSRLTTDDGRVSWLAVALLLLVVAGWSAVIAVGISNSCFHLQGNVTEAEPDTPRGDYCHTLGSIGVWLFPIVVPVVLAAMGALVVRRRIRLTLSWVGLVLLLTLGNWVYVGTASAVSDVI